MTPTQIAELARDIDFAVDVTEPRDVRLRRFEDAIRAAVTPPAPPALTAAEMVARLDEAAAAVACAVMMLNDGSRQSALDEMGKVQTKLDAVLAALAAPPPDGTAWLIERDYAAGTTLYWTGRAIHREPSDPDRLGEWSPDVYRALRFARRADAECMLTWHCQDIGRVAEHLWIAPTDAGRAHYCIGCGHHWTGATPGTVCGDCWRDAQKAISDVRVLRAELESAAERDACRIVDQHAHRDLGQRYAGLVALVREWQEAVKAMRSNDEAANIHQYEELVRFAEDDLLAFPLGDGR